MKELTFSLVWLADWDVTSGSKLLYARLRTALCGREGAC